MIHLLNWNCNIDCWICVEYVYSSVTTGVKLQFDRLGIEFELYFVSLGPINMRALLCNRETTWRLVWAAAWPRGARMLV